MRSHFHPHPARPEMIVEGEIEAMQMIEALFFEGKLNEIVLGGYLRVLQWLSINILYLCLYDSLEAQVIFLLLSVELMRLTAQT